MKFVAFVAQIISSNKLTTKNRQIKYNVCKKKRPLIGGVNRSLIDVYLTLLAVYLCIV